MRVLEDSTTGTMSLGDRTVRRLGFGAMRVSGARDSTGVRDRETARRLVRRVVERGVTLIDTANIYGYGQSEEIIGEALRPYPDQLVVLTKAGFKPGKIAPGQTSLPPLGRPEHIREECDKSLGRLGLDCLDVFMVHVPDPEVPYADTVGAFVELQQAGKVRHIAVSNVTVEQLAEAQSLCDVVAVENKYNALERQSDAVLARCEADGIAFLPWQPVLVEGNTGAVLDEVGRAHGATAQQVSIAWLLGRSPVMVPIPGTSDVGHLDQNVDAAWVSLTQEQTRRLDAALERSAPAAATERR